MENDNKEIIVVDSQRLGSIQNCACKYDYVFNKNYIPVEQAFGIERGSLVHEGLETYYKVLKYRKNWPRTYSINDLVKTCIKVMEHRAIKMSLQMEAVDEVIQTFKDYVELYHDDINQFEVLAVEQVGTKVMYEDDELVIVYETKIDRITRMERIGIMPWDVKTYSRKSMIHPLNNQFIGYCWMLDVRNLMVDRIGFQKTLKPKEKHVREIKSYPATIIDQWVDNSVHWIKYLRRCYQTGSWPQNYTSCDKFNSQCLFTKLCMTPPELRGHTAAQLFNIGETWDVGAKL